MNYIHAQLSRSDREKILFSMVIHLYTSKFGEEAYLELVKNYDIGAHINDKQYDNNPTNTNAE